MGAFGDGWRHFISYIFKQGRYIGVPVLDWLGMTNTKKEKKPGHLSGYDQMAKRLNQ